MVAPRLVILDKSFLQAESRDCRRLRALTKCGCRLVLTDTLVYEICTGRRETQWAETQRKLFEFADKIDVWRHVGELLKEELVNKRPIEHPVDIDLTEQVRDWFSRGTEYAPNDLGHIAREAHQRREVESVNALIRECRVMCERNCELYAQIRQDRDRGKDLRDQMNRLVNRRDMVNLVIRNNHGNPKSTDLYIREAEEGLGSEWFAYHHARSILALWCVFMLKYGEKDQPGKEFRNTKLDADYSILLHYADALATNETSGSMADMCSWLYGGSKKLFSSEGVDSCLPAEDKIRLDAFFT